VTLRHIFGIFLALLIAGGVHAQTPADAELRGEIRALASTLRVLQVTAHPGDEDGALLLYAKRSEGARVTLLTLTRGERGDNPHSIMEPDEQGLLRTMEQLASDERYGAEQRFARMVDFGFARTADEVFDRWGGHNTALNDIVRVIRETRPEIIVAPYDANTPDGDGQHQATVILVREAFRAAADAKKFPEQLKDGLEPWQAKRLFMLARSGGFSVAFNAGQAGVASLAGTRQGLSAGYGPTDGPPVADAGPLRPQALGEHESWQQQAEGALAEQHSQQGMWHAPRDVVRHYRLVDFAPGAAMGEDAKDFAEGLSFQLESLAQAVGAGAEETRRMRSRLAAMQQAATAAAENAGDRAECVAQLAQYLHNLRALEDHITEAHTPGWLRSELAARHRQAERALLLASGMRVQAQLADDAKGGTAYVLVPGENFEVQVQVELGTTVGARVAGMELKPEGGRWSPRREWEAGDTRAVFRGRVPPDAPFTRPQFLLDSPNDGAYMILDERNATRALPPPSLQAVVELEIAGEIVRASAPVQGADNSTEPPTQRTLMVAPPVSVIVEPRGQWNRRTNLAYGELAVRVRSNLPQLQNALLSLHPPNGWRAEPEHEVLDIENRGEEHLYHFYLIQERGGPGAFPVSAVVRWGTSIFNQGYTQVRGSQEKVAFAYRPSNGLLISTPVDVPDALEVGYLGIPGDPLPAALDDLGVRVTVLDTEQLMHGRLGKHWAIVMGPHAVDEHGDLAEARSRLLQFVEEGGVVVILAQSDATHFAARAPVPYALEPGTARVANAASAVEMIDEHDDILMDPNEIGILGFDLWSEERGHNFAESWDGHYESLLRMNDPGRPVQEGVLLRARYGRGSVVYTGLAFDVQVRSGVPGALRLLVNLLSQGAELHR
jgi:LmbE family N-acetylglucosaminyl deacetylase